MRNEIEKKDLENKDILNLFQFILAFSFFQSFPNP